MPTPTHLFTQAPRALTYMVRVHIVNHATEEPTHLLLGYHDHYILLHCYMFHHPIIMKSVFTRVSAVPLSLAGLLKNTSVRVYVLGVLMA